MRPFIKFYTYGVVILLVLVGCKIQITVPEGGKVNSKSGNYECVAGQVCTIDVYDLFFDETFLATANPGYTFLTWRKQPRGFCANSNKPCHLYTSLFAGYEALIAILESDDIFYLEPLFLAGGRDAILSGHYGSSDDTYSREAIDRNTRVLDPHKWDKACPLTSWPDASTFFAITGIEWWGYYTSIDLPVSTNSQEFEITFYKNASEIVARRRLSAKPVPSSSVVSPLWSSPYASHRIYGYQVKFVKPLQLLNVDVFYSIVQVDSETGESESNFIWHGDYASPGEADMWFLTDYGGWIKGSASRCRAVMTGYHSGGYSRP